MSRLQSPGIVLHRLDDKNRLKRTGITHDTVATDNWDSFLTAFADNERLTGKAHNGDRGE